MLLRELHIGDMFYPTSKKNKSTPIFRVTGKPIFNARHGSATRMCLNLSTGSNISKSCRMEVIVTHADRQ